MNGLPTQPASSRLRVGQRLADYSLLAGAMLAAGHSAQAAIVYTDVDPDESVDGSFFSIDMDGDGIIDFTVRQSGYSYASTFFSYASNFAYFSAAFGNEFRVPGPFGYGLSPLPYGTAISPTASFSPYGGTMGNAFRFTSSYSSFSSSYGLWGGLTDRYAGVKFQISGVTHYGWVRMDVPVGYGQIIIKDFAYEDVPNTPINAGDKTPAAEVPTALAASDISDNGNGTDLELAFTRAVDETTVSEYRLIVSKSPSAPFNRAAAEALPADRYTVQAPIGSDIITTFTAATKDVDGDVVVPGQNYVCFVLSMPDGVLAMATALSDSSNVVTLLANSSPTSNVVPTDVANTGTGQDMAVAFTRAPIESTVGEYRIIVVDSAAAPSFNLTAATAITAGNYTPVAPNGTNPSVLLAAGAKDADGDPIANDVPYVVFVLSVADGTIAQVNALSSPSAPITLRLVSGLTTASAEGGPQATWQDQAIWVNADKPGSFRLMALDGRLLASGTYEAGQHPLSISPGLAKGAMVLLLDDGEQHVRRLVANR